MLRTLHKIISRILVLKLLFFLPPERKRRLERWLRGREEFQRLRLADAVVVSFGKSGRTWLRVLLSRFYQLRYGLSERHLLGFDNLHRKNRAIPRVFFTHDNYLRDFTGNRHSKADFAGKKVILLARDPRDTAVSQHFQWKHRMRAAKKRLNDYPAHGSDVQLYQFVTDPAAGLPKIIDFMNGWAAAMPQLDHFLLVRYEDMRADPQGALRRVLEFLGENPSDRELEEAVSFASVENMRAMEGTLVFWMSGSRLVPKDRRNPDSYKVRRAKVGGYRDYFDPQELVALDSMVSEHLSPVFGYTPSSAGHRPPRQAVN